MYNTEQKTRFVKSYTESVAVREEALRLFNALEPWEEHWGADLCTRSVEDIRPALASQLGVRNRSGHLRMKLIREYGRWCLENHIPDATETLLNLQDVGIERVRQTTLRNPRHLQSWLDLICVPESSQTADNAVRVYCWLGYAGFSAEDALTVRSQEVDFRKQMILHNGREYPIYRESLAAIHNCVELELFNRRRRIPSDILIRGIRSAPTALSLRVELTRKKKHLVGTPMEDMDISFLRIWRSGLFYRMYEDEHNGLQPDFLAAADAQIHDLPARSTRAGDVEGKKRNELAKEYRIDYERWKQTLIV